LKPATFNAGKKLRRKDTMTNSEIGGEKWPNNLPEGAAKVGDKIADAASQAKERVSEFGRTAAQKVDESRGSTAATLKGTADSIRSGAQSSGQAITDVANRTAEKIDATADYIRDHDFRGMMADLEQVVRRNPTPALVGAIGIGFLLGAAMRGRN
jgi:ElaB/YqjD/DUF883 family membrane-anchored ribosome-binding protein